MGWAVFRWLRQTPLIALLGAVGFLIAVWGVVQQGLDLWHSGVEAWVFQLTGLTLFATFLVLLAFKRDQDLNSRLEVIEGRTSPPSKPDETKSSRLSLKVQSLVKRASGADAKQSTFLWPEMEATLMSIAREYDIPPADIRDGASRESVNKGLAYLLAIWPYVEAGHLDQARIYAENLNRVLLKESKTKAPPPHAEPSS